MVMIRAAEKGGNRLKTLAFYVAAAVAEIAGCFGLWIVVRDGASTLWLVPGVLSLVLFA